MFSNITYEMPSCSKNVKVPSKCTTQKNSRPFTCPKCPLQNVNATLSNQYSLRFCKVT